MGSAQAQFKTQGLNWAQFTQSSKFDQYIGIASPKSEKIRLPIQTMGSFFSSINKLSQQPADLIFAIIGVNGRLMSLSRFANELMLSLEN